MGVATWTGPIKAGDVVNTTGTTPGTIRNVGFAVMAQTNSTTLTQAGISSVTATNIVIPANSHIVSIQMLVFDAFSGTQTINIGTTTACNELVVGATPTAVGQLNLTPGTDKTRTQKWSNVGTSDVIIYAQAGSTGTGTFDLIVRYIQAENA